MTISDATAKSTGINNNIAIILNTFFTSLSLSFFADFLVELLFLAVDFFALFLLFELFFFVVVFLVDFFVDFFEDFFTFADAFCAERMPVFWALLLPDFFSPAFFVIPSISSISSSAVKSHLTNIICEIELPLSFLSILSSNSFTLSSHLLVFSLYLSMTFLSTCAFFAVFESSSFAYLFICTAVFRYFSPEMLIDGKNSDIIMIIIKTAPTHICHLKPFFSMCTS